MVVHVTAVPAPRALREAHGPVVPIRDRRYRELTVLHPALAARYTAIVAAVAPAIEAATSCAVMANRVCEAQVDPPSLRLASWRMEHAAFRSRLGRLASTARALLFADVRDCYASIRPEIVEASLRELGCEALAAANVSAFLLRLDAHGVRGLPVGPDASAVLANAVLGSVDRALERAGVRHLRWVDDVVAAADGADNADRLVGLLRAQLRRLGLELNESKTRLVLDPEPLREGGSVSVARASAPVG